MALKSAGILLFRRKDGRIEFFLVHPGGPFFLRKDLGAWSIPKGEFGDEHPEVAARREFYEETGMKFERDLIPLTPQKLKGGKVVHAFGAEGDFIPHKLRSNPSKFGWPEVDRGEWFDLETAKAKINPDQTPFLDELTNLLDGKELETSSPSHE